MKTFKNPAESEWKEILQRPVFDVANLYGAVGEIIEEVKTNGDKALIAYTKKFDGVELKDLKVPSKDIKDARKEISDDLRSAIKEARRNIENFHAGQVSGDVFRETTPGVKCWQRTVPIEKVGLYIPGGSAPLLSTALMLGVPAVLAGCSEIVLCTPPGPDGTISAGIRYIADQLGIDDIYTIGGAQAIASMAYGTESVKKVYKIYGPGNQYVTAAKQLVNRDSVAIDMPAGPSELAVVADSSAVPSFVASDLLSQAEHGPDSQVILISDSQEVIDSITSEIELQLTKLPRKAIAAKALLNSKLILLEDRQQMIKLVNAYAPEHLIIACENYNEISEQIVNAGSIFLGNFTPESAGDYASGTNHTLPTNGWAQSYSGLNMDAFVKKITYQEISEYGLFNIGNAVMTMAEAEELQAHSNAVKIRLNREMN